MKKFIIISKIVFFAFTLFIVSGVYAQVGIGTTEPNEASLLDLSSPNKGLLIPRVELTATNLPAPLSAPVAGMLVYNTASNPGSTAVSPGFYYNDGTNWIKLLNAAFADLTDDAWLNDNVKKYIFLNTLSDGTTVRPVGTEIVVTDNGRLGIGTDSPTESIEVMANDADLDMYSFGNDLTVFHIHAAGGTLAAPAAVSTRETKNIFSIESKGYDGEKYVVTGAIVFAVDGVAAINDMPGKISFSTTPDGEKAPMERMVIKNTGNIGIGTSYPKVSLDVNGMIKAKKYTVATLPSGTEVVEGAMAYVTDALDPSYLNEVVGNGNIKCPVFYNGSTWVAH